MGGSWSYWATYRGSTLPGDSGTGPWVLIGFSLSMFSQLCSLQLIPGKEVGPGPSMLASWPN